MGAVPLLMFNPSVKDTLSPSSLVGELGFAGVATVFKAINESDNGKLLPGIGTGIRFRAFPETNFSVGIDVAAGIDDWGIYFQLGEVF